MMTSPVLRSVVLGLSAAALSLSAAHAAGPPRLVSASPAKDAFTIWPKQIRLTFDQPLAKTDLQLALADPDGRRIRLDGPLVSGKDVSASTAATAFPVLGPYMLTWQGRTASGDPVSGDYSFFVQ